MTNKRSEQYAQEDKHLSGGRHGIGNLVPEVGDEQRSHGCFRGEEIGPEASSTTPVVVDKKPSL